MATQGGKNSKLETGYGWCLERTKINNRKGSKNWGGKKQQAFDETGKESPLVGLGLIQWDKQENVWNLPLGFGGEGSGLVQTQRVQRGRSTSHIAKSNKKKSQNG